MKLLIVLLTFVIGCSSVVIPATIVDDGKVITYTGRNTDKSSETDAEYLYVESRKTIGKRQQDYRIVFRVVANSKQDFQYVEDDNHNVYNITVDNAGIDCNNRCWMEYDIHIQIYKVWLKRNFKNGINLTVVSDSGRTNYFLSEKYITDVIKFFPE